MIFCVRQLVEKAIEHIILKCFCYFLTCVRPTILWQEQPFGVLCKSMVYPKLWLKLCSLCMKECLFGGGRSEPFSVQNGLHQGCTIAPTLFIMYFGLVIDRWLSLCQLQVLKCSLSLVED